QVALLDGETLIHEEILGDDDRTARALAPAIDRALAAAGWEPRAIELVAVTIGPGSFTGLRVGVTTAKTWAYAVGCAVLGVDTLETVAAQVPLAPGRALWAVLDAQRQQLFATCFTANHQWQAASPAQVIDQDAWLHQLSPGTLVTGSGLKRLVDQLPAGVEVVDAAAWTPRAETVGRLAWRDYQAGRRDDLWKLSPRYLRPSAAEEKAALPREGGG